jgi:hypothetical protein
LEDIDGDLFVRGVGAERVAAGEVEHAEFAAVRGEHFALAQVHGDAGVVADFFVGAGEGVEKRGFSDVRISHKGERRERILVGHLRVRGLLLSDGFDHDLVGEVLADGETGAADRADQVSAAGEFADLQLLAETHVAQAITGRSAQEANPHIAAYADLGKGHGAVEFEFGGWAVKHSALNLRK